MSVIYNVMIEATPEDTIYKVIWHNVQNNTRDWFTSTAQIKPEETRTLWQNSKHQMDIGEKLFRFLDGDARHFKRALAEANGQGETLQVYLRPCLETADWPFEVVADEGEFLLLKKMHLVRWITDWGIKKPMVPQNRPLKCLFMACSAKGVEPELDFEGEEDAIYRSTQHLAMHLEVEDSGSLEGLARKLENQRYDVIHLSGHANITTDGAPYFVMEDEFGDVREVFPETLWNEALLENPPRLLFLSGCRTGETPDSDENHDAVSFAHLLVDRFNVPAVLGWGRSVNDGQAIVAETKLFQQLSGGKSILEAVQQVRGKLQNEFFEAKRNDWPLLRLFSSGMALNPMVTQSQKIKPTATGLKRITLKNGAVSELTEGFVGSRRQMQQGLRSLKQDYDKVGLLLLGTAGLGKSCLAAKMCQRLPDFTEIVVHGSFNAMSLEAALTDAFIIAQDKKGTAILAQHKETPEKLTQLCASSFKEGNYIILLDDFDQNIEGAATGQPGRLSMEAAELLNVLLRYLPIGGKMTQLIITSRYGFSLTQQNQNLVAERLEPVYLTSFSESQQLKKLQQLDNLMLYHHGAYALDFMSEGKGNPRLLERLDDLVGQMFSAAVKPLMQAIKEEREKFIQQHLLRQLWQRSRPELVVLLRAMSGFDKPVKEIDIAPKATPLGLANWQELLVEGIRLSLIEHNQAHENYQVTPLLLEELGKD